MIRITREPMDPAGLLAAFCDGLDQTGAVVSCVGLTRARDADRPVTGLTLQAHPRFTEAVMTGIEAEARRRFDIQDVAAVHRWGGIAVGEPIIFVAVAARHRRPAFEACDYLMDQFKTRASFWKREDGPDGGRWIEPREEDMTDLARWAEETR